MKKTVVKLDAKNRVTLTKVAKNLSSMYRAYAEGNKIILEPIIEVAKEDQWLFEPKNKALVDNLKKSIFKDTSAFKHYFEQE